MTRLGLTRQGVAVGAAGLVAIVIGRVFGIIELFVIAAAFFASVIAAVVYVRVWITEFPDTDFMAAGEVLADRRARSASDSDHRP